MASAHCKSHTDAYRNCLKDCRDSGRSKTASKTCKPLAVRLDRCREDWRRANPKETTVIKKPGTEHNSATSTKQSDSFDGTRVLPHPKCRPLSCDVQRCIEWKRGDQSKCKDEIQKLHECMQSTKGTVAAPTEGDKIWSV
eukprot:jgi/Psemu1/214531/e_gw1.696.3.1